MSNYLLQENGSRIVLETAPKIVMEVGGDILQEDGSLIYTEEVGFVILEDIIPPTPPVTSGVAGGSWMPLDDRIDREREWVLKRIEQEENEIIEIAGMFLRVMR